MKLTDLLPALHELPRPDKVRAVQFLANELAHEETGDLVPGAEYSFWSPHDAHDAAATLTRVLGENSAEK